MTADTPVFPPDTDPAWFDNHSRLLARSFREVTGESLIGEHNPTSLSDALFQADFILVSHNGAADPILNYGNAAALKLWELSWEDFTKTPSRYTAEEDLRADRREMLMRAKETGLIRDYSGVRISSSGRRFMIRNAWVWTLMENGLPKGQAAMFRDWEYL